MGYHYTYFLIGVGFGCVWLLLYLLNKKLRREMLVMSIIFAILGPISNILFIKDWWVPLTIDGTSVGIIDSAFVGFVIGGVTGVLYEIFQSLTSRKSSKLLVRNEHIWFFLMVPISLGIFFGGFYLLNLNSFITSTLALFVPAAVVLWRRKDLVIDSFVSGILLTITAIAVYNFVEHITPGWVSKFWQWQNTPKFIWLNTPIDDMAHYFFLGLFGGPLYEYWEGRRLFRKSKHSS